MQNDFLGVLIPALVFTGIPLLFLLFYWMRDGKVRWSELADVYPLVGMSVGAIKGKKAYQTIFWEMASPIRGFFAKDGHFNHYFFSISFTACEGGLLIEKHFAPRFFYRPIFVPWDQVVIHDDGKMLRFGKIAVQLHMYGGLLEWIKSQK